MNMHLPHRRVTWKGYRGGRLADVPGRIFESISNPFGTRQAPCAAILHVGTNDLINLDLIQFKVLMQAVISECARLLPDTIFIWSDILPRFFYKGARSQKAIEVKRKEVNRMGRKLISGMDIGRVVRHTNISWDSPFFRDDGVHLNETGQQVFTTNLREALHFFWSNPDVFQFQPSSH